MEFPNYALYTAIVSQRDIAVLTLAILVAVAFEILILVRRFYPRQVNKLSWFFIGVYYASLFAMVVYLRSGAAAG